MNSGSASTVVINTKMIINFNFLLKFTQTNILLLEYAVKLHYEYCSLSVSLKNKWS